jgi:catechol-2,3-dioxygenase
MNIEGVVVNVTDVDRSVDFYHHVLGFTVLFQNDQLATVGAPESHHSQVIVFRGLGTGRRSGARHVGLRAFVLEATSADQSERIASELDSRGLFVGRRDHGDWSAVIGRDPDGVAFAVAFATGVGGSTRDSWRTLDDALYGIGE